jgi:hypothetical protein
MPRPLELPPMTNAILADAILALAVVIAVGVTIGWMVFKLLKFVRGY